MRTKLDNGYQGIFLCVKEDAMIRLVKIAVIAALFVGMRLGSAHAGDSATGENLATGPVIVAQDTMRDMAATLHSRLDAYRKVVEYSGPAPSDSLSVPVSVPVPVAGPADSFAVPQAYGSAILDYDYDRYMNRFWVGGLGTWQSANGRSTFDGWKYKGAGVMLGYDRAFGATMLGASIAYVDGNYENKTAVRHDSKIEQYAANVYATYSASSGFFTSVMAGYTLSDNELNEELAGSGIVREDYRTQTLYAGGRLGYDIEFCDTFNISPSIGVDFFYSRSSSHDLKGTEIGSKRYSGMRNNAIEIPVDVKASYEISMGQDAALSLMANLGYAYNLNDKAVYGETYGS
ncbi:MAG: autotransporter outer membrane beta-barrel domain-containing protein, partial [Planctomycetota bacterium]|nr:autotransporter outer membrane beta-barrel domain-containing protein [Planctomycetota bacterium]